MSQYLIKKKSTKTPQSEAIPGTVENSAGGYSFAVNDFTQLDRFLILGSEGGSYYANEQKLTKENAGVIKRCVDKDGIKTVNRIVEISQSGRAPKNDPALFALAVASVATNKDVRKAAYDALPKVARIGTHLFHFVAYREAVGGGWGRGASAALSDWYNEKDAEKLAYQLVKYQSRDGWSHRDILRLAHPYPATPKHDALFRWVVGWDKPKADGHKRAKTRASLPELIEAVEAIRKAEASPKEAIKLIRDYNLPREVVPTQLLTRADVWDALLTNMPLTAMVRNLGNMSKVGLLTKLSKAEKTVVRVLGDAEAIQKARVHPIQMLVALRTYGQGHGNKGKGTWEVSSPVTDALDDAFYLAFDNVQPTGKNIMLALDVSGSMGMGSVAGVEGLTPRDASAALALVTARVEKSYEIMGFSSRFMPLNITPKMTLEQAIKAISGLPFEGTDCALPMIYAATKKRQVDAFVIYTDSETWVGDIHPNEALAQYRRKSGVKDAKSIVVGLVSNGFSIADPSDAGMLDVTGFDTAVPQIIEDFIRGGSSDFSGRED
jgi:60 kDa SS-A/Ro ribonucleoprotein